MMDEKCPPHHWIISQATGPTSDGICLKCDALQVFSNAIDRADIAKAAGLGRGRGREAVAISK